MSTAIEKMTGIYIKSDFFINAPTFELFPATSSPETHKRVALLYGKNGSGKTSLAQGFREYRDSADPVTVELLPKSSDVATQITGDWNLQKFFVYDEDYVTKRVKIKNGGLDAIVLFGEQSDLETQIEKAQEDITKKEDEVSKQQTKCAQYATNTDVNSPDYWQTQIHNELKKDAGWADKGSKIKGLRQNLSVTDSEIEKIGCLVPTTQQAELEEDFCRRYAQFAAIDTTSTQLPTPIPLISIVDNLGKQAIELLAKEISRPQWTEREHRIFELLGGQGLDNAKNYLSNSETTMCCKCLQPISETYRSLVLQELDALLNQDVKIFKGDLIKLLIPETSNIAYQANRVLTSYSKMRDCLDEYIAAVTAHNASVQEKIDNPFKPMIYSNSIGIVAACGTLNRALTILEAERVNYNRTVNKRNDVMKELLALNDDRAHYYINDMYTNLKTQRIAKTDADNSLRQKREALTASEEKKAQLNALRENFKLAVEEINHSLEYIFYCKGRLMLEIGADRFYHLKVNGHTVSPNKVSCGERNALALCYFFTEIVNNMNANSVYSNEVFLVIDDPVSSFDSENRIGVLSLLRWKLEQVLNGCATSKVLIMTHDVGTVFDLEKGLQEIQVRMKRVGRSAEFSVLELKDQTINKISDDQWKRWNEYTQLLERIYEFAKTGTGDELVIGNIMRRALEAFSTFSYKKGIETISTDETILAKIESESHREYFLSLMYRLVLNDESHYEDYIKGMKDYRFFGCLSDTEKQRTARDILCLMFLLNERHVQAHLPSAKPDIAAWCKSIDKSTA